jgi:hypothetical protein
MNYENKKPLLSPTNDHVFRRIFGDPKNVDALNVN